MQLTPAEALASSLNFYGCVDMGYLTQTTGKDEDEVIDDLKGEIFYNPATGEWEHKGKFIARNVIAKSKETGSYLPDLTGKEKDWAETAVKALEEAMPEAIPYEELDINMGERWIDTKLYADFATELFGTETDVMYFDVNDTYLVRLQGYSPIVYNTYSVKELQRRGLVCTRIAGHRSRNNQRDRAERRNGTSAGRGSHTGSGHQDTGDKKPFQPVARLSTDRGKGRIGKGVQRAV